MAHHRKTQRDRDGERMLTWASMAAAAVRIAAWLGQLAVAIWNRHR
jgi:phage terminase small subunit